MTIAALVRKTKTQKINHRRKTETGPKAIANPKETVSHRAIVNHRAKEIISRETGTTSKAETEINLRVTETGLRKETETNLRIKVRRHLHLILTTNKLNRNLINSQ